TFNPPSKAGKGYSVTFDSSDRRAFLGVGNRDTNTEGQIFSRAVGETSWTDEGLQDVGTLSTIITDTFTRTVSGGWGTADLGGSWTLVSGGSSNFSVNGSVAAIVLNSGGARTQFLNSINSQNITGTLDVAWDRVPPSGLPYKEMLGKLKAVLNPAGIFVIDTTHFLVVPTGTAHKTYTNRTKGVVIQTEIDEVYKGIKRIREITNTVNGKTFHDHSEMDVLTEAGLVQLLTQFGFRHEDTYYDYSQDKPENAKRIQLIFDLH
ncbi:hypothetical protein TM7_0269, partial [candidate division TM7 genomosp. GTL1]